jgi:universal stress protein A
MKRIDKLLVPTDLSDNSRRGLLYACSLAADTQGALTILHGQRICRLGGLLRRIHFSRSSRASMAHRSSAGRSKLDVNRFLEPHLAAMKNIPAVNKRLVLGPIAEQIVMVAEEEKVDLVVLSPRRNRGLWRILSGGISDRVTRMSPCPVLSVAPPLPSRPWRGALLPLPFRWSKPRPAAI